MIIWDRIKSLARLSLLLPVDTLVDAVVSMRPINKGGSSNKKKKLLIVRLDAIGDFIVFLDTFKEYRKLYPANMWEITLLGNKAWSELAENLGYGFSGWYIDRDKFLSHPSYRYRILRQVRSEGFDTVVQPTFSREYMYGDAVIRASDAPERIGSAGSLNNMTAWQKKKSDRWYTRLVPASNESLNELDRNAEFLQGLGKRFHASPPVYPVENLPHLPKKPPFVFNAPYFVISAGAAVAGRRWPADRFAAVAAVLFKETGMTPVICGGAAEKALAEKVISCRPELPWKDLAGKTSLGQLLQILSNAGLLISNETSAVHLAASVGCPVVCTMGGGHFGRFFPYGNLDKNHIVYKKMDCYGCNWWCKHLNARCILDITVDDVLQEIHSIINKTSF